MNKATTVLTKDAPDKQSIKRLEKKAKQEFIRNFQKWVYETKRTANNRI